MLGRTQPCAVEFGHTNGIQAASAAGRPDGRQTPETGFTKAPHRATGGTGLDFVWMAMAWGMFPR